MNESSGYYILINVGIGAGIAADAMLATITRSRTFSSSKEAIKWAAAIGLTHWLFPMIGFLGGWYLATHGVARGLVYGVGGAVLLFYVFQVLRQRSGSSADDNAQTARLSFWLAVWGVSIDALVTGPGKAAATAHWTTTQVALSFPFVGTVVFILVLASTIPAMVLHRRMMTGSNRSWHALAIFFNVATWVEVLVFTWFAMLSMVEACGAMRLLTPSYSLATGIALLIGIAVVSSMGARVWRAQAAVAQKLVRI